MCAKSTEEPCATDFGTISLNSSIFNLPAGVSPILMSMNTIGRTEEDICGVTFALCDPSA